MGLFFCKNISKKVTNYVASIKNVCTFAMSKQVTEMTNQIATQATGLATMTADKIELVKRTIAKGATTDELELFLHLATKHGLDPFAKEIWFIKYGNQQPTIFTSRDGYLKIAHQSPDFEGIRSGVVCENDDYTETADGVVHVYGKPRGAIIGAYAVVYNKRFRLPVVFYVPFAEYNNPQNPTWKKYPSAMIVKVAEAMALKRAFSISGMVTVEEMAHHDSQTAVPVVQEAEAVEIEQPVTAETAEALELACGHDCVSEEMAAKAKAYATSEPRARKMLDRLTQVIDDCINK